MEGLSVVLTITTILVVVVPIASVIVINMDNLMEVIIPPEIQNLLENLEDFMETLQTIELVNAIYNQNTHTLTLIFSLINHVDVDLQVNMMEADVVCAQHDYPLGNASLINPVELEAGEKTYLTVIFQCTAEAEQHITENHSGENTIDVDLVNFTVDINGITIQTSQRISLTNVPFEITS